MDLLGTILIGAYALAWAGTISASAIIEARRLSRDFAAIRRERKGARELKGTPGVGGAAGPEDCRSFGICRIFARRRRGSVAQDNRALKVPHAAVGQPPLIGEKTWTDKRLWRASSHDMIEDVIGCTALALAIWAFLILL